ncbi:hypothetical protein U5640_36475 [Streptomyces sp. SS7]|uniref:hypothetical protein n=1 Tax=Streptomyces sp. SS7 TaxID=3108485 RepID=UPI0030ECABF9
MTPITGLDLTGFTEYGPGAWEDDSGVAVSVHFFPVVPDLPAPLHELARLRAGLAQVAAGAGGGLVEAVPATVGGLPAVCQLVKVPLGGRSGQAFVGSLTVPRAACSAVVKVQAAEEGTTGLRESMIMAEVGLDAYFRAHPYVDGEVGGLPSHVADDEEWDARFPGHPLTLVRATLRRIAPTVTLDDGFRALPPFGGPVPPQPVPQPAPQTPPQPPKRGWFRRKGA